jgi:hypothetical protein
MFDLRARTNQLEDGIITLSGPALAISGIIAGTDLLTGGTWMQSWPWLTFAWAVTLLLTLDFQVLSLGARVHHIYQDTKKGGWQKIGEIALAVVIAASISYVSIQMQSIIARSNNVSGLSIAQATEQLGINPIWLIWERSALVLVLIFLSGWFREEQVKHGVSSGTSTSISDETAQVILAKLAKLDQIEQAFNQQKVEVLPENVSSIGLLETGETPFMLGMIEQRMYDAIMVNPSDADELLTLSETMSLDEFTDVLKQRYSQYASYITPQRVSTVLAYARSQKVLETGETEVEQADLTAQLQKLLSLSPDITSREAASIVGKPPTTVYRHMTKLKQQ